MQNNYVVGESSSVWLWLHTVPQYSWLLESPVTPEFLCVWPKETFLFK